MSFSPDSFNRKMCVLGLTVKAGMVDLSRHESVYIRNADKERAQEWCQERFNDEWIGQARSTHRGQGSTLSMSKTL